MLTISLLPDHTWRLQSSQQQAQLTDGEALWTIAQILGGNGSGFLPASDFSGEQTPIFQFLLSYDPHSGQHVFFGVRSGDRYEEDLCADEALWLVSRLLQNKNSEALRTREQHEALDRQLGLRLPVLADWQRLLPVV